MKIKRIIALLVAICTIFTVCCVGAFADNSTVAVRKYWDDDDVEHTEAYSSIGEAINASSNDDEIYLIDDDALTANAVIPSGVTLIVTSNGAYNDITTGNNTPGTGSSKHEQTTLTINSGVTLTVYGTLLVAGNQQSSQPKSGCLSGNYGAIDLKGNIILASSAKLYARGEIYGNGTVTANNGAKVYQLLQINDWRGGSETYSAYNAGVFPFNCYEISSIKTNATYNYGSYLYGQYYIYAGGTATTGTATIIGTSNALLSIGSGGYIETIYDTSTERLTARINGTATTGDVGITYRLWIFNYSFSSANKELPFGYNIDVVVAGGSTLNVTNKIKLLPGCTFTNNGTLNVTGNLYVYGVNYASDYNFKSWSSSTPAHLINNSAITGSGHIASSVSDMSNVPYSSYSSTTTIKEYRQGSGTVNVVFYVAQ